MILMSGKTVGLVVIGMTHQRVTRVSTMCFDEIWTREVKTGRVVPARRSF